MPHRLTTLASCRAPEKFQKEKIVLFVQLGLCYVYASSRLLWFCQSFVFHFYIRAKATISQWCRYSQWKTEKYFTSDKAGILLPSWAKHRKPPANRSENKWKRESNQHPIGDKKEEKLYGWKAIFHKKIQWLVKWFFHFATVRHALDTSCEGNKTLRCHLMSRNFIKAQTWLLLGMNVKNATILICRDS